jgi:dTMP kinase
MTAASYFVSLEGIDNAGKTSLLEIIEAAFSSTMPVCVTRELTSPIGPFIRSALTSGTLSPLDKTLLFAADRQLRLSTEFLARLSAPGLCLADRWTLSAAAYRGADEPLMSEYVTHVNRVFPSPTLTILIDIPPEVSFERGAPINKNNYDVDYLARVRAHYLSLAPQVGALVIDGTDSFQTVSEKVIGAISDALGKTY